MRIDLALKGSHPLVGFMTGDNLALLVAFGFIALLVMQIQTVIGIYVMEVTMDHGLIAAEVEHMKYIAVHVKNMKYPISQVMQIVMAPSMYLMWSCLLYTSDAADDLL